MRFVDILPFLMIIKRLAVAGRWGSAAHWAAAGVLNIDVVFLIGRWE